MISRNIKLLRQFVIPIFVFIAIVFYLVNARTAYSDASASVLFYAVLLLSIPFWYSLSIDILNKHFGVDVIAGLCLVFALIFKENLAAAIILLMLSGGEAFESYAMMRARQDLSALVSRAPTTAHKKRGDHYDDIKVSDIDIDDILLVKSGEVIPVDGIVIKGRSFVDESTLTGESMPVEKISGKQVLSGTLNGRSALIIRASRSAKDSKYEQIIRLVKDAEEKKAPIVRLADRYSAFFTLVTLTIGTTAWLISGTPERVLAVLVVATPCPLILATPIAIVSGISKAARKGIIVKDGGAFEKLAEAKSFAFDKTGTITLGMPKVIGITDNVINEKSVLRISASLDQLSSHVLSKALIDYAVKEKKIGLHYPEEFKEYFGDGVSGKLDGKNYCLGKLSFLSKHGVRISKEVRKAHEKRQEEGTINVYLGDSRKVLGTIIFSDELRSNSKHLFDELRDEGVDRIVIMTGDKENVAKKIAGKVGINEFYARCLPSQKTKHIKEMRKKNGPAVMVGDGINDAPALAEADVGIAITAHDANVAAESADMVITSGKVERVNDAFIISRRAFKIAKQGIFIGMGVSIVLMLLASQGYIQPISGAIMQEVLDITVIINSLRVGSKK